MKTSNDPLSSAIVSPELRRMSAGPWGARVLFCVLGTVTAALTGCGMGSVVDPGQVAPAAAVEPPMSGSVYGGHAPLVGAHVYVLTPSTTANAGLATSLMKTSTTNTQYPLKQDTSGGSSNGMYYATTDQYGVFNLTGSYSCTANQPVYLVATGGAPSYAGAGPNTLPLSSITVSNVAGTVNNGGTATYTFNLKSPATDLFYVGEQVTFANTSITASGTNSPTFFNSGTYTITGTGLTTTSFQTTFTADYGGQGGQPAGTPYFPAGTTTQAANATVTGTPENNPAVANMTEIGVCPTSGNFSTPGNGAISYIFMNEISTAVMAYATSAFGTDAFHIGVNQGGTLNQTTNKGYVTGSMLQAFNNAYLMYDITGGNLGTAYAGEGHIGRATTPEGNGTVPQTTIDTLGNILAACVDSANTSSSPSTQCSTLFATATADGTTTGTKPTDISGAAFNIAHHPAGSGNSSFVSTLYTLPVGNVPFLPQLSAQPNDFTLTLQFTISNAKGNPNLISNPQIVTIDGSPYAGTESGTSSPANSVWVGSYGGQLLKMFTNGTPDYTTNATGFSSSQQTRSIAFDTSNNPWVINEASGNLQHFSNTGTLLTTVARPASLIPIFFNGTSAAVDASSNVFADYEDTIEKVTSTGTNIPYTGGGATALWSSNNTTLQNTGVYTNTVTLDSNGLVYTINNSGNLCVADSGTAACKATVGGFSVSGPNNTILFSSIDGSNTFWSPNTTSNNVVGYNYTSQPGSIKYTCTGGGLNYPVATAVDGAGDIWVANAGSTNGSATANSLSEFGPTCTALSPTGAYAPLSGNASLNSASLAVDRAGNVWVVYSGNYTDKPYLYEVIGIATPAVSATSFATFNGWLGKRPL